MSTPDTLTISRLSSEADGFARAGQLDAASERFRQILAHDPGHVGALSFLGLMAFRSGHLDESARLIERALQTDPQAATLHLNLALIQRRRGDIATSINCLETAILIEPRNPVMRFHLGSALAAAGQLDAAALSFAVALELAPRLAGLARIEDAPAELQDLLREAHSTRKRYLRHTHEEIVNELRQTHGADALARIESFLRTHHGEAPLSYEHPLQRPNYIYIPGIPPRPWFEREEFDWIETVEAAFADVRRELDVALAHSDRLHPYVDKATGAPSDWDHLTDKTNWSSFHLLKGGLPVPENVALCPATTRMLETLPLVRCQGNAPEAFFSILKPGIEIPPHVGLANFKLAVHLALDIPEGCAIEVGGQQRGWQEGRCLIFDDSFEHSAWNRGGRDRAVLIFEVWNPYLEAAEREAISAIIKSNDDFHNETLAQLPG